MEVYSNLSITDGQARMLYKFRGEVGSQETLDAMILLIKFCAIHGEHAVEKFKEIYATSEGQVLNAARRRIDMLYDTVRIYVEEWNYIPAACVPGIMEPGSVDSFLKWVYPLSAGKPSPKAGIEKQKLFWEKFGTGGTPAIINAFKSN